MHVIRSWIIEHGEGPLQNRFELSAVRPLPWRDGQGQRTAAAVRAQVDFAGEAAPRAAQALVSSATSRRP